MIFSMKIYLVYFFAKRVKKIKNKPIINQDFNHKSLISQYENTIKIFKRRIRRKK